MPEQNDTNLQAQEPISKQPDGVLSEIIDKINNSRSILIALSKNPSVDEMAAAIALSIYLDKIGKVATAIYSGKTPDALEFLRPGETFERTADVLQDFVIALNKEKADHLRYKVDGDFVKIFITPYRVKVSNNDLNFSYGDYNVDLVLALDVANGVDLDSALREHGRIMHDAVIVNMTTSAPGKFGEIEWSDQGASSISEMVTKLLFAMVDKVEKEEATALLTGIVAATGSFSNARTTSDTMKISSDLMDAGANQQLVAMHIKSDTENELFEPAKGSHSDGNSEDLNILHDGEVEEGTEPEPVAEPVVEPVAFEPQPMPEPAVEPVPELSFESEPMIEPEPMAMPETQVDPVSTAELSEPTILGQEIEAVNNDPNEPAALVDENEFVASSYPEDAAPVSLEADPVVNAPEENFGIEGATVAPNESAVEFANAHPVEEEKFEGAEDMERYGQMLEEALAEQGGNAANPATTSAPVAPVEPEINGVPVINYAPAADEILTPPPTPPVNMDVAPTAEEIVAPVMQESPVMEAVPEVPTMPEVPAVPVVEQPVTPVMEPTPEPMVVPEVPVAPEVAAPVAQPQPQAYVPQDGDVSAFKIPNVN